MESQLGKILELSEWTWAKSYSKSAPHWYTKLPYFKDPELFHCLVVLINKYGKEERFYNQTYKYFYTKTHKYWTMTPYPVAILINKTRI
mgnify:FL=1